MSPEGPLGCKGFLAQHFLGVGEAGVQALREGRTYERADTVITSCF